VNWGQIQHWYRSKGISTIIHEPTLDDFEDQYARELFRSACTLNDLIKQGHRVFMNCTAGVSRAPTVMLVYLALFIRHEKWEDIEALYQYIEFHYRWQDANMKIAKLVIEQHKEF
jgi:protein-tyrosine phosphatase